MGMQQPAHIVHTLRSPLKGIDVCMYIYIYNGDRFGGPFERGQMGYIETYVFT